MIHSILFQNITKLKISLFGIILICAMTLGISLSLNQRAAAAPLHVPVVVADVTDACSGGFFGLEPWYHFMPKELNPDCSINCFNILDQSTANECGQQSSDIPGVLLAVIDDLLRVAGLVAVAFIIVGSFQFVASRGNSERAAQAQGTVISALTGLAVALVAVAFISFIGSRLTG